MDVDTSQPRIVVLSTADLIGPGWDPDPIGTAIGHLGDRDAHVIRTAYLGDQGKQPDRVVAIEMGIDRSRVKRIRHRALTQLRTELGRVSRRRDTRDTTPEAVWSRR